jgi:hypothetical protein
LRHYAILIALFSLAAPLSATAGEVAGTVYDQRGAPAAGVVLALGELQALSGADGTFAFADVSAGEHTIAAGNQRVVVSVAAEGTVRRNLFLLGRSARTVVTGEIAATPESDAALAATFRMAEAMLRDTAGERGAAWQWNDLEG